MSTNMNEDKPVIDMIVKDEMPGLKRVKDQQLY
jgi:hypothetical protein